MRRSLMFRMRDDELPSNVCEGAIHIKSRGEKVKDRIVIIFQCEEKGIEADVDVPVNITANDLIVGLNEGFHLGMSLEDRSCAYFVAMNPRALVRGSKTLEQLGLRDGSLIMYGGRG